MNILHFVYIFICCLILGLFLHLAGMNNATANICVYILCGYVFNVGVIYIAVEFAESYGNFLFNLLKNHQTLAMQMHFFTFPSAVYVASNFSTFSTLIIVSGFLKITVSVLVFMWWYYGFDLHFPYD